MRSMGCRQGIGTEEMLPRHGLHGVESSVAGGELSALSRLRTAVHAPVDEKRKQHSEVRKSSPNKRDGVWYVSIQPFVHCLRDRAVFSSVHDQRLFILAPCIQMEFHYKELSPNEEAHFSDTGDVFAAVRSKHT